MPLKVVRRKGPNWYVRGTVRGQYVEESTGTADRAAAEAVRIRREAELLDRSVHGAKASVTFIEAALEYIDHRGEERFVLPLIEHFGTTPLAKIRQAELDRAAAKLYPGRKPSTRNRQVYGPFSAVLKFSAARERCDLWTVQRMPEKLKPVRWLTPGQADRLIDCAAPHLRPLLVFLFYTGARLSEALYLDWHSVDLSRAHVYFPETKNGTERGVPLHPRVVAALANLATRQGPVFRTQKGLAYAEKLESGGQIKTGFNAACGRAGIMNFTPHDCRHTWASWHYQIHRDLIALKTLGGWKSERMVLRYTHLNTDHLAPSIAALPWKEPGASGGKSGERENETSETGMKSCG